MDIKRHVLAVLAAALALAAVLLAACGGQTEDEAVKAAPAAEGVVQFPEATAEVRETETPTSFVTQALKQAAATPTSSPAAKVAERPVAPELQGIVGWLNLDPLMIQDLRGKVVLVDFWTYTCVNYIRTLPYLKLWHAKYADDGLVILGVHTPEFEFEKKAESVRNALAENGIG